MSSVPATCIVCGTVPEQSEINSLPIYACGRCGLKWRQSFDVPLAHYEDKGGAFSSGKAALQRRNIRQRIRILRRRLTLDNTCDVGGSKGYFVDALLEAGYKNVFGIDPNKTEVEAARRRGSPMVVGSTADAPALFQEWKTKNATLFHVIEHLPDPAGDVASLFEALPSGGYLVVETPDFASYAMRRANFRHKLVYEEHLFYFTFENLQTFLHNQGFLIAYAGKRDFDQWHLDAGEAFFRLGLTRREAPATFFQRGLIKVGNLFLPVPLSAIVALLGRQNFSLVIAKKP